jgi:DNA repair protein RecN (Recombination protein N)
LIDYTKEFQQLRRLQRSSDELSEKSQKAKADLDYYEFQFTQLNEARLKDGEQKELETEQELLTHSEEIKSGLENVFQLLDNEDKGSIHQVKEAHGILLKLAKYLPHATELGNRMESIFIELRDIASECEQLAEKTEFDPKKLELISDRLNTIYTLQQKHRVETVAELIGLRDEFDQKITASASFDAQLEQLNVQIKQQQQKVKVAADGLHTVRKKNLESLSGEVASYLHQLAMPGAVFKVELVPKDEFGAYGTDEVFFLFSANKAGQPEEINKVASGGELSRLMLAIKTVVAKSKALPAIVFDEIDTGISGETAIKMGNILRDMSQYMQVVNITHLPQIASKGQSHYQVYKKETNDGVETGIRKLNNSERISEIAKMLSGDDPHQSAIDNAKALLQIPN